MLFHSGHIVTPWYTLTLARPLTKNEKRRFFDLFCRQKHAHLTLDQIQLQPMTIEEAYTLLPSHWVKRCRMYLDQDETITLAVDATSYPRTALLLRHVDDEDLALFALITQDF
jgi:hypothetical protein